MADQNPCWDKRHCDTTDWDDPDDELLHEKGCCTPIPVKRDCRAPVLPEQQCGEASPVLTYDPETGEYTATSTMYYKNCSAWLDKNNSPWLALIA